MPLLPPKLDATPEQVTRYLFVGKTVQSDTL